MSTTPTFDRLYTIFLSDYKLSPDQLALDALGIDVLGVADWLFNLDAARVGATPDPEQRAAIH